MTHFNVFQEYECPIRGIDNDLTEDNLAVFGESFLCELCGNQHIAGVEVKMQTAFETGDGYSLIFRELPKDRNELNNWLLEIRP